MLLKEVEIIKVNLIEFIDIDNPKSENIDVLITIITKRIRVEFNNANPHFTLLGDMNEDLIAKDFFNYDHPDDLEIFNKIEA